MEAGVLPLTIWFSLSLCVLCLCDKSESNMDKIVYFIHHADQAINKSIECLNDPSIFNSEIHDDELEFEKAQVFESSKGALM